MDSRKGIGIALTLFFISLGGRERAEAGFASRLADTHRFRLSFAGGTMRRDMGCSIKPNPYVSTWDEPYGFIRAGYGIADRLRVSLDVFGFRQRSDLGDMVALCGAFGASVQGTVLPLGPCRSLDAGAGYWEEHYSRIHTGSRYNLSSSEEVSLARAISVVLRQELTKSLGCYAGALYNHTRYEELIPEYSSHLPASWMSHRDIGAVGGSEAKLFNHWVFSAEGFYTGDWGLTGEVGWEF